MKKISITTMIKIDEEEPTVTSSIFTCPTPLADEHEEKVIENLYKGHIATLQQALEEKDDD